MGQRSAGASGASVFSEAALEDGIYNMRITKRQLKQIIKEEVQAALDEKKKKGMLDQPTFQKKVNWVKKNKPKVKDPEAYVAATLRKTGELKD